MHCVSHWEKKENKKKLDKVAATVDLEMKQLRRNSFKMRDNLIGMWKMEDLRQRKQMLSFWETQMTTLVTFHTSHDILVLDIVFDNQTTKCAFSFSHTCIGFFN